MKRMKNDPGLLEEYDFSGGVRGKQYWFRIRVGRSNQPGLWSDQATRVANI